MKKIYLSIIVVLLPLFIWSQDENLNVLRGIKFSDVENALFHYYADIVFKDMDKRQAEIAELKTVEDWHKRQKKVKKMLAESVGEFPEKTPLNARILGIIKKPDYRIEKIIFESQPKFYVTGILYIPNNLKGKAPAIVFTSGHAENAYRWQPYQQVCANFAKKGFIVFAFDPLSQGERKQYWDSSLKKSKVGGATAEHTYEGNQCILIGKSLARFMIWDGIRAIDYLLTRPEVDKRHIGITGHSGGGTQSSYIAAFDERIYAEAPECFITSMKRIWETIGPQDAEQVLYHGIKNGLDFADYLEVRAPKPALQITTTRDFFSIQGARDTEKEIKKVYHLLNADDNYSRIEDDAPHEVTKKNRERRNAFFQKHLNLPGNPQDEAVDFLTEQELQITQSGQVITDFGGETIFTLNKKDAKKCIDKLEKGRENIPKHIKKVISSAKQISGYIKPVGIDDAVFAGRYQRNGYNVEKYYIKGEGDYPIPFLLFVPEKCSAPSILYLNPEGKIINSDVGGEIERLVKNGHTVLAADLIGFGEMKQEIPSRSKFASGLGGLSDPHWGSPIAVGGSIVGIHAMDIQRLVLYLKKRKELKSDKIYAVAKGDLCPALLHAAAFEKSFSKIVLINPLISYRTIVMNRYYKINPMSPVIPGVLTAYDLADIAAALAPYKLLLISPLDQMNKPASQKLIEKEYGIVFSSYHQAKADKSFEITTDKKIESSLSDWLDN